MGPAFSRKYATGITAGTMQSIKIPIPKRGVVDFAVGADWTPATGDVKVSKDGGAAANVATLPAAVAMGNTAYWEFVFSSGELTCGTLAVTVSDSATKAVEDQMFLIETFGNASAMYPWDMSLANIPANLVQILGTTLTETAGQLAAAFKQWFNVATPTGTVNSIPNAVAGAAGGLFIAGSNAATTANITGNISGNLSGSVGSVTGAVGSVTGAVGSVTGNVGGNVAGSTASVTGAVGSVTGNVGGDVQGKVLGGGVSAITGAGCRADQVTGAVGSVTGAVGSVTGSVGSITGNVAGNVTGSIGSLAAQAQTDVKSKVVEAINTDPYGEPGQGAPGATISIVAKIGYLFKAWRNKSTQTSTQFSLLADDALTVDQKAAVSDDGTTFSREEIGAGP